MEESRSRPRAPGPPGSWCCCCCSVTSAVDVELMIVATIIAIIAVVAIAVIQDIVKKSKPAADQAGRVEPSLVVAIDHGSGTRTAASR